MGTITLTRKKSFVGMAIKYHCILNMSQEELSQCLKAPDATEEAGLFDSSVLEDVIDMVKFANKFLKESDQTFALANGESITIELDESRENNIFVLARTSGGHVFSNKIAVSTGKSYAITTKFSLKATKITIGEL